MRVVSPTSLIHRACAFTYLLLLGAPLLADEREWRVEVTPFAGATFGGEFEDSVTEEDLDFDDSGSFGLIVNWPARAGAEYEIYYSHQSTKFDAPLLSAPADKIDVDVDYLHIGGTLLFPQRGYTPYFVFTAGASRFKPKTADADSDVYLSFGIGGGAKFWPHNRVGLMLEARVLGNFVNDSTRLFCGSGSSGGICAVQATGSMLWQYQLLGGVTFRF